MPHNNDDGALWSSKTSVGAAAATVNVVGGWSTRTLGQPSIYSHLRLLLIFTQDVDAIILGQVELKSVALRCLRGALKHFHPKKNNEECPPGPTVRKDTAGVGTYVVK